MVVSILVLPKNEKVGLVWWLWLGLFRIWAFLLQTDNHDGVITHLDPDILECEVKWAFGSITMNKASGGDRTPVELFQILKDAMKVLHSISQQIWKTQQWPRDWKRSVFIPIPKKGQCQKMLKLPNNCTHLLYASKVMLKFLQASLQQYMNCEIPDV